MKKVLSIVLCVAMILGSFSMVVGAATLTDRADINETFNEAVDVMTTTGIIEGYEDGSFKPEEPVTRAQMAKMISVLMNGGDDVSALYANANKFTDMENANWAKGFVAYCVGKGIIAGRSASIFDPSANVTATEAAKMLLVALGYDADIEGYVGSTWKINVQSDAKDNDLYDDLSISDYDAPLTRESAAQLIFNAMQANTVEYARKNTVTVGDVVINQDANATTIRFDGATGKKYGDTFADNAQVPLWAKAFDGDLKYYADTADDFGRPSHQWKYDDGDDVNSIGKYADDADYEYIATKGYASLQKFIDDVDEDLYDDIYAEDHTLQVKTTKLNGTPGYVGKILPGDMVEIFEADDSADEDEFDELTVVIKRYFAATISDIDTDVSSSDAKDGTSAYVTFEILAPAYTGNDATIDDFHDDDFTGFDAETYVEDAYIAIAINAAGDVVCDSYLLEKAATAEVTRIAANDGQTGRFKTVTAGETYTLAGGYSDADKNTANAGGDGKKALVVEDQYDFYLDENGYLILSEIFEDNASKNYGVLTGISESTDDFDESKVTYQLRILTADGKETIYNVNNDDDVEKDLRADLKNIKLIDGANANTGEGDTLRTTLGSANSALVKFTLNSDGEVKKIEQPDFTEIVLNEDNATVSISKNGTIKGAKLSKDVVAFYYDDPWTAYTYDQLLEQDVEYDADAKNHIQLIGDGDAVLMLLGNDIDSSDDTFGIITDLSTFNDGDPKYEVELFVDGKKVTYNTDGKTNNGSAYDILGDIEEHLSDGVYLVRITLNKDDEITMVELPRKYQNLTAGYPTYAMQSEANPVSDFATGAAAAIYSGNEAFISDHAAYTDNFVQVGTASSSNIRVVTGVDTKSDYFSIADAKVYRIKIAEIEGADEGDRQYEIDEVVTMSASSVKEGGYVILIQTDEDSEAWDTVLYMTASDFANYGIGEDL